MSHETDAALAAVLEAVRARLQEDHAAALAGVAEVRAAIDAYVASVQSKLTFEFLVRNGIHGEPPPQAPEQAARHLLELVRQLPPLASEATNATAPASPQAQPPVPTSDAMTTPSSGPADPAKERLALVVVPERSPAPADAAVGAPDQAEPSSEPVAGKRCVVVPLDDDGLTFKNEFEAIDFDNLKDADFLSYANEFAGRARLRQEQGLGNASDVEGRIIRRLTALAAGRSLPRPVFGLSRAHKGDWAAIVKWVRDEREGRVTIPDRPTSLTHRLSIPASVDVSSASESAETQDDERAEPPLVLPRLQAAAAEAEVVMVGGLVKREKLDRVRARTGIEVEWIGLSAGKSAQAVAALAKRIREGRIAALVILNGLMQHKEYEPIIAAAREVGLPVAYADKAGKGALVKAFVDLEGRLAERAAE